MVTATDAAGNISTDNTTVVLDDKAPLLVSSSVRYEPSLDNPLTTPQAGATGALVVISMNTTEAHHEWGLGAPTLTSVCGGTPEFPIIDQQPWLLRFHLLVDDSVGEGDDCQLQILATFQDDLGNEKADQPLEAVYQLSIRRRPQRLPF